MMPLSYVADTNDPRLGPARQMAFHVTTLYVLYLFALAESVLNTILPRFSPLQTLIIANPVRNWP